MVKKASLVRIYRFVRAKVPVCIFTASFFLSNSVQPDWHRVKNGDGLYVKITEFSLPNGNSVRLIPLFHLATPEYFNAINEKLVGSNFVLLEGLRGFKSPHRDKGRIQSFLRKAKLVSQYSYLFKRSGWETADIDLRTLPQKAHKRAQLALEQIIQRHYKKIEECSNRNQGYRKCIADLSLKSKVTTDELWIQSLRNQIVVDRLKKVLLENRNKRVSIAFGAAHIKAIEKMILNIKQIKQVSSDWVRVWKWQSNRKMRSENVENQGE